MIPDDRTCSGSAVRRGTRQGVTLHCDIARFTEEKSTDGKSLSLAQMRHVPLPSFEAGLSNPTIADRIPISCTAPIAEQWRPGTVESPLASTSSLIPRHEGNGKTT